MNVTCDKCRDADPECKFCHGHPYTNCRDAECVLWMREGYQEWKTGAQVLHEAMKKQPNLTEYASKARPMSTFNALLDEARERYAPGTGPSPSSKTEMLDQVDLVFLENMVQPYKSDSGPAGRLCAHIDRLVKEVRAARAWPTPPSHKPNFKYAPVNSSGSPSK